jgi:predicted RNase H-like HicB family nuclease
MEYLVVYEKSNDGSIWARVPDVPGCSSCGDTVEEARENIKEAIELHLEALKAEGIPIPVPNHLQVEVIEIEP